MGASLSKILVKLEASGCRVFFCCLFKLFLVFFVFVEIVS
ncbi:hypothetical protein BDW_02860 [Bdellovibrio bacteriovorus W]|nr:hypothetical protein BDW_02860 [Bdellovibrio bacteriovorus W]